MDRNAALDILESALLSGRDDSDPRLAEALRVLEGDADAGHLMRVRSRDDERIARAMRDVPVPAGAKERLLQKLRVAALGQVVLDDAALDVTRVVEGEARSETKAMPGSVEPATSRPLRPRSRRTWLIRLASAALLIVVALGLAWRGGVLSTPPVALDDLRRATPVGAPEGAASDLRFASVPSAPGWHSRAMELSGPFAAEVPGTKGSSVLAAFRFRVQSNRRDAVQGWLLVTPANRVSPLPPAASFQMDEVRYAEGRASVAWVEGDLVYVCVVQEGSLDLLRRVLEARPA